MENDNAIILWDIQIITDKYVLSNRPYIVIQKKRLRQVQDHRCGNMKATEKMSKYVDFKTECQRMQNKKVEVIPIIIGTTETLQGTSRSTPRKFQANTTSKTYRDWQSLEQHTF